MWGARRELDITFVAPLTTEEVEEWDQELTEALVKYLVVNELAVEVLGVQELGKRDDGCGCLGYTGHDCWRSCASAGVRIRS